MTNPMPENDQNKWMYDQPDKPSPLLRGLMWLSVALLLISFGGGITYLFLSKDKKSDSKDTASSSSSLSNSSASTQSTTSEATSASTSSSSSSSVAPPLSFVNAETKKLENFPKFAALAPTGWKTEQLFGPGDGQYYLPTAPRLAALRITSPDDNQTVAISLRDSVNIDMTKTIAVDTKDTKIVDKNWVRYYDSIQKFYIYRPTATVITATSDNAAYRSLRDCNPTNAAITCPTVLATTTDITYLKGDPIAGYTQGTNLTILLPDSKSGSVTTPCTTQSILQQCSERNVPYLIIFTGTDTTAADTIVSKISI
jgi:hypothetical protein